MRIINTLIVDDERLARVSLRALLAGHPDIRIVAESAGKEEAVEAARQRKPDLIFLDIQMLGGSGFDVLAALEHPPPVIFVTAHDRYAIRAFEVNALDYLLKPVEPERLSVSLGRIRAAESPAACRTADSTAPLAMDDHVVIDSGRRCVVAPVADILAIHAEGNYTRVFLKDETEHMIRVAFNKWTDRLPEAFAPLSRSLLIQTHAVSAWESRDRGLLLRFRNTNLLIKTSRTAADRFRKLRNG